MARQLGFSFANTGACAQAQVHHSLLINVKMLENRNLIGYYILPEVYEKEVSKQEIKMLRMFLLDVFVHVRDGQWERNLKMGDAD